MSSDPTTASIVAQCEELDRLRADNHRLGRELASACTTVERLKKLGDEMFVVGYDQAVREIRDHFAQARNAEVVVEIEKIWRK